MPTAAATENNYNYNSNNFNNSNCNNNFSNNIHIYGFVSGSA